MLLAICGLLVTFLWLVLSVWYVEQTVGFEGMMLLLPNEIGQFVIGVFAPIAFLWLILAFFHVAQRLRRLEDNLWHQPVNLRHEALPPRAAAGTSYRAALQSDDMPEGHGHAVPPPTSPRPAAPATSAATESAVLTLSDPVAPPPVPQADQTRDARTDQTRDPRADQSRPPRIDPTPPPRPAGFEPRRASSPPPPPAAASAAQQTSSYAPPPSGGAPEPPLDPPPLGPEPEAPRGLAARLRSRFRDIEARDGRGDATPRSLNPLSLLGGSRRAEPAPLPTVPVNDPPARPGAGSGPVSGSESVPVAAPPEAPRPPLTPRAPAGEAPPVRREDPPARPSAQNVSPQVEPSTPSERADASETRRPRSVFRPSATERPRTEARPRSTFAPAERPDAAEGGRAAPARRPREEAAARLASRTAAEGTSLGGEFEPAEPPPASRSSQRPSRAGAPERKAASERPVTQEPAPVVEPPAAEPPATEPLARAEPPRRQVDPAPLTVIPDPAPLKPTTREAGDGDAPPIEPRPYVPAPAAKAPEPAVRITPMPAAESAAKARPGESGTAPSQSNDAAMPAKTAPQDGPPSTPNPAPKVVARVTPAPPISAAAAEGPVPQVPDTPKPAAPLPEVKVEETQRPASQSPAAQSPAAQTPAAKAPADKAPAGPAPGEAPAPADAPAAPRAAEGRPIGFRHLVRITTLDLNTLAMDLSSKLSRPADHAKALKSYDRGEKDVFFDQVRGQLSGGNKADLLRRLDAGGDGQLLDRYVQRFERLLEESRSIDVSGALAKSLEAMAIGRLYGAIQGLRDAGGKIAATGGD